jgi:hypothetical protein
MRKCYWQAPSQRARNETEALMSGVLICLVKTLESLIQFFAALHDKLAPNAVKSLTEFLEVFKKPEFGLNPQ